jgi:hypothetical protein
MSPPPRRQEQTFGLSVLLVCGAVAGHLWSAGKGAAAAACLAAGLACAAVGRVAPARLAWPSAAWWRLLRAVGWVNTRIILGALFYLALTPLAVVLRLAGWDALGRRTSDEASGWTPAPDRLRDPKHYERMY